MKKKQTVTVATLAEKLGVSTATVAKALNGQGRISEATIRRVKELAKELKYVPNQAARSLRTNVKDTVGLLITSDISSAWYSALVSQLETEFSRRGLTMLLALGKSDQKKIGHAMESFFGGRVRGIIAGPISNQRDMEFLQAAEDHGIPLVIFSNLEKLPINFVALDQEAGARIMLEHLYQLGHRRIAYFGALSPLPGTRQAGYHSFMEKFDLEPENIHLDEFSRKGAYDKMTQLLKTKTVSELPTALLVHNDDMALGVLLALQQAGIKVPEEISVTGFDDIAESSFCIPGLTTIGGIMESMVKELVDTLDYAVLNTNGPPQQRFIIPKLIQRATTAKPAKTK